MKAPKPLADVFDLVFCAGYAIEAASPQQQRDGAFFLTLTVRDEIGLHAVQVSHDGAWREPKLHNLQTLEYFA